MERQGPSFHALHRLFDDVYEAVDGYVDQIAERIVQLGGLADGTAASVVKRSSLPPYASNAADGMDHVRALSSALGAFGAVVRTGIEELSDWGDAATADLMTEISRGLDKYLWMVEAHIQSEMARS